MGKMSAHNRERVRQVANESNDSHLVVRYSDVGEKRRQYNVVTVLRPVLDKETKSERQLQENNDPSQSRQ